MGPTIPTTNVRLVIVPNVDDLTILAGCEESVIGKIYSVGKTLSVNHVIDGYAILYRDDDFQKMDMNKTGRNLINILTKRFPNTEIALSIYYNFRHKANRNMCKFDDDAALKVIQLANYFYEHSTDTFKYFNSESVQDTRDLLMKHSEEDEEDPLAGLRGEDEDDDDEIDFSQLEAMGFSIPGYDPDDDDDEAPKGKKKRKQYGRSRLVSNGKNPKKDYNRHGVIVSRDSDDLNRDRKMIKNFLKDFIPGNARWKRDFRDDLLERWMDAFVVRKKKLRKLEKKMRKKKRSKKPSAAQAIAMGIGRQIMAGSPDAWSNPNK